MPLLQTNARINNMSPAPLVGDELMLNDDPYLITNRRFVIEDTERNTKNVDYTILFVRKNW
ncbi:hypothetical protein GCM10028816_19730 [Spirosoma lituiforme]